MSKPNKLWTPPPKTADPKKMWPTMLQVTLRDVETGKVRIYNHCLKIHRERDADKCEHEVLDCIIFIWTEGNYSCDCNRWGFLNDWQESAGKIPCNPINGQGRVVIDEFIIDGKSYLPMIRDRESE